jgi:hypothetical protein
MATLQTEVASLQAINLLLELFPAFDWSKASYRIGRDLQPQELTIAKEVRQGEDFKNGRSRPVAFNQQDALNMALCGRIDPGLNGSIRQCIYPRTGPTMIQFGHGKGCQGDELA